jgi:hypothetical protein
MAPDEITVGLDAAGVTVGIPDARGVRRSYAVNVLCARPWSLEFTRLDTGEAHTVGQLVRLWWCSCRAYEFGRVRAGAASTAGRRWC